MKEVSTALATHLAGPVTTLATCWSITRRDGARFRFTDHDRDITFDGEVYLARFGYARTAVTSDAQLAVDNLDVDGFFDDEAITEADMRAGLFDYAEVRLFLVNWADPAMGALRLRRGWLGELMITENGMFRSELRGLTQALQQEIGELYSAECRADLGDPRCKVPVLPTVILRATAYAVGAMMRVPLYASPWPYGAVVFRCTGAGTTEAAQPAYDATIGAGTLDGTATFVAEAALTRPGEVLTVSARTVFIATVGGADVAADWFAGGVLTWVNGPNAGRAIEVKTWNSETGQFELYLPVGYAIEAGHVFRVAPGCDKRLATCKTKFANVLNFRGEPFVPGVDSILSYPDAS
ncbi:DUF2163 domain-containing protein [Loktanella sp. DJP18]|uniref:DUF2163 domain-containing protein n=1 Tax=Loktanella sp. DJP18 TaxID=3409788 RepID=UPI003BB80F58